MNGYDDMPPLVDPAGPAGFIPPPPGASMHDPYGGGYNGGGYSTGYNGGGYNGGAAPGWGSATDSPYFSAGWNGAGPRRMTNGAYDFSPASSASTPWGGIVPGTPYDSYGTPSTFHSSTPSPWGQPDPRYTPPDMSLIPSNSSGMNYQYGSSYYNGAGPPDRQSAYARPLSTGPYDQQQSMTVRSHSPYHHGRASSLSIPSVHQYAVSRSASYSAGKKRQYSSVELGNRPSDWRRDFSFRTGLAALLPRPRRRATSVSGFTDIGNVTLSPNIQHNSSRPPLFLDLRNGPGAVEFFTLTKPFSMVDMMQLISTPPIPNMRLYHSHLPWYIDIIAQNPTGITMHDFFDQMCGNLMLQIKPKHYYTEEMNEEDRRKVAKAFKERCEGHETEISYGIRRIDYLRGRIIFEGISKGKDGMWEMKTRKA